MGAELVVPRRSSGTKPPLTKATTLVPPSHAVSFCPRSGQLFPAMMPPAQARKVSPARNLEDQPTAEMHEPLSAERIISVSSHRSRCLSAPVTFAIPSSTIFSIEP